MSFLVLSRNVAIYSTRRLTEAFRSRGRTSTVLDPAAVGLLVGAGGVDAGTRGGAPFVGGHPMEPPEAVVPRIGFGITHHSLALLDSLESRGVPTTAESRGVRAARDKMSCLMRLSSSGIPVPPTVLIRQAEDSDWAIEAVGGPPVVLKFLSGTHGVGVFLAESRESARTVLDAMLGIEQVLLVQAFVESAAGADLRLFIVDGRVVASIRRSAPAGSFRANLHGGGVAEAIRPDPAVGAMAIASAGAVGLAVAGVDILESDDGPLVNEVNSSPGLEGIEGTTGVDVAEAIVDFAIRLSEAT